MQSIDNALEKLSKSKFRSSFHLKAKDIAYIDEKGMDTVRRHAEDFIEKKLAPMKNHPVFIAQHACACCCRGCLEKWYKVPKGRELTKAQQEKIVNLLMAWIKKEYNSYKNR